LTQGNVAQQLFNLTLPMSWGVFAVIAFQLIDTYFVGQLGTTSLAAMSFTFPVVMTLGSLAMGLGVGSSSIIARAIGEGNTEKVQRLTTDSLTLSLGVVVVFVALGLATIDPLFRSLGAEGEVLAHIRSYMEIWYWGMIFLVIPMVGNSAIRAAGNMGVPSVIMTVAAGANILLDPLFMFGWGPFPALGLPGAAVATVISRAITLVASLWFLHFRLHMLCFNLPPWSKVRQSWQQILQVGLPAATTNIIQPISLGVITSLVARYGAEAVAGFGIASRVEAFALLVFLALSASMGPFVGQNWGAQKYGRVRRALQLSFGFCLGWGIFLAVVLAGMAPWITGQFDSEPEVMAIAITYLLMVPISYGAQGIFLIASSTSNALGKPTPSVVMMVTRMVVLYLPLAYVGSWLFQVQGIFGAACVANLAVGMGAYLWNQRTCISRPNDSLATPLP
jgi:putative MATE family efflux protein